MATVSRTITHNTTYDTFEKAYHLMGTWVNNLTNQGYEILEATVHRNRPEDFEVTVKATLSEVIHG